MNKMHYHDCITRLQENANGKKISVERQSSIWHVVKDLPEEAMNKIVSEWCAESNGVPTRSDIISLVNRMGLRKAREKVSCDWCGGEGMVEAYHKDNPDYSNMFRCSCANGTFLSDDFIRFSSAHAKNWVMLRFGQMAPTKTPAFKEMPGLSAKSISFYLDDKLADINAELKRRGLEPISQNKA